MTTYLHPHRKLTADEVREIRRDYSLRRRAQRMLAEARAILDKTPTCGQYARHLRVSANTVLAAARGRTYTEVRD